MISRRLLAAAFSLIMMTGARCGTSQKQQSLNGTEGGNPAPSETTQLFTLINQERALRGLQPYIFNVTMASVAKQYTRELSTDNSTQYNFAINGQDSDTRLRLANLSYGESGHFGLIDFNSAETALAAMINSQSFVLSQAGFWRIGIGESSNGNHIYWTILVTN